MWRQEDEALLGRLEDELLLERLWRAQVGSVPPPHPRAAGLCYHLRKLPGGQTAATAALSGKLDLLYEKLLPARLDGTPPELLHHMALYFHQVADALGDSAGNSAGGPPPVDAAVEARVRSIAAWLALSADGRYLRQLSATVAGRALAEAEIDRVAAEAPLAPLDDLGQVAREGARERTGQAQAALAALSRIQDACRTAHCSEALAKAATRRAERHRAAAADEALSPIAEAIAEASARGHMAAATLVPLFRRVALVWQWAGHEEGVERFAVEQLTPIAWEHYRAARWGELRTVLGPIEPLVDSLGRRIQADPAKIAYAGPCAQIFVFRSEVEDNAERQLQLAEHSLQICPTHRNGRLILANLLLDRAAKLLEPVSRVTRLRWEQAAAHIERAEQLFPASKRLGDAKQRLGEAKRSAGIVS